MSTSVGVNVRTYPPKSLGQDSDILRRLGGFLEMLDGC
jgi:hypothetical protein